MQLGSTRLSPEERLCRQRDGRCFYCGQLGHQVTHCHVKGAKDSRHPPIRVSQNIILNNPTHYEVKANFHSDSASMSAPTFIDSGSDANLMNLSFVRNLGLTQFRLRVPLEVKAVDGSPLGKVTHCTQSVRLTFPDNHTET